MNDSSVPYVKKFLGKLIVKLITKKLSHRDYGVDTNKIFDDVDSIDEYLNEACKIIITGVSFTDMDTILQPSEDNHDAMLCIQDIVRVLLDAVPMISTLHRDDVNDISDDFMGFVVQEYDRIGTI